MAPKKNAFLIFVNEYKQKQMTDQTIPLSFPKLVEQLTPKWNSMSETEKNKFKMLADKANSNRKKATLPEHIIYLHNNSSDYWMLNEHLENMFELIADKKELLNKKFILLHVNCHTHEGEKYYFPAEIAALEFSLSEGISRTYHQIVGLSDIYPRGYAGSMREYSDEFHQINCWDKHPDDYKKILSDFISFLYGAECSNLKDSILDLPCMFTIETEVGLDMMKTKSSLSRLYKLVFPETDLLNCKPIFKIGSIERLLFEMNKKMKIHLDKRNIRPGMLPREILEAGLYGYGLGCMYHEERSIALKCSKARILQWMSNICKHISVYYTDLQLIPGKHIAVQLKNGSRMIIENEDTPLTKSNLRVKK